MLRRPTSEPTKGWALSESEGDNKVGLGERLRESGRLWTVLTCLVVCLSMGAVVFDHHGGKRSTKASLNEDPVGVYTDADHRQFAKQISAMAGKRGMNVRAKFTSDREFELILPCDAAYDEMVFLSRAAALGISRRFRVNPTICTYTDDVVSGQPKLAATTDWSDDKSDFVVNAKHSQ